MISETYKWAWEDNENEAHLQPTRILSHVEEMKEARKDQEIRVKEYMAFLDPSLQISSYRQNSFQKKIRKLKRKRL